MFALLSADGRTEGGPLDRPGGSGEAPQVTEMTIQKDLENHLDEDLGGLLVDGERACSKCPPCRPRCARQVGAREDQPADEGGSRTSDREKLRNPRLAEVAPVDREAHARWVGRAAWGSRSATSI